MPSKYFEDFYRTCIGPQQQADYVDEKILLKLEGKEREDAVELLLDAILTTENSNPIQAVGYLKLTQAAEILRGRLLTGFRFQNIYIDVALALWRIEQDDESAEIILDILRDSQTPQFIKEDAIRSLGYFKIKKNILDALFEVAHDNEQIVLDTLENMIDNDKQIQYFIEEIRGTKTGSALDNYHQKKLLELRKIIYKRFVE